MRFLSGRASCGARALLRALLGGTFAVLGLIAGGCGNTIFTYGTPVISFSTTPGPFSAYVVEVSNIVLTRSDNTPVDPLIIPEIVDFVRFNDLSELFGTPAVIEGTYTSATISLNYASAQIYANVNGTSKLLTVYDGNASPSASGAPTVATTVNYTIKFDPAHPLVIKNGVSTPIDFNFDLSASSVIDTTAGTLTIHPMLTASTQPVYPKPLRSRGLYVTTDTVNNNNFTINSRAFFDLNSNPNGAVAIQTDANTTYNINGTTYTGAAGLAAINALPINTIIESIGTLGDLNAVKPTFVATQVYAGVAVENPALDHVTGTVASRSGNNLVIRGAEVQSPLSGISTGVVVAFYDTLPVTLSSSTLVTVDGQPNANATSAQISVGSQIDIEGVPVGNSDGSLASVDASGGLVRLVPTTLWGTVNSAQGTTLTSNLLTEGGFQPEVLTYTGTGSATGEDSNPTAYQINNASSFDATTLAANSLVRVDGLVSAFGAAPPDFTASAITPAANTDQLLIVDWVNGGSASPFTVASDGITLNMSDANLGTSHFVQTGPTFVNSPGTTTVDLTNPVVNAKIVPDPQITGQFSIGNASSTGYSAFHSYSSFQTQVSSVLNGTNKIQKLVAVGKWDGANFTAYRIDIVQLP